jgi:hypothetical protein
MPALPRGTLRSLPAVRPSVPCLQCRLLAVPSQSIAFLGSRCLPLKAGRVRACPLISMPAFPCQSSTSRISRCLRCWAMPVQPSARRANRRLSAHSNASPAAPRQSHASPIRALPFLTCRALPCVGVLFVSCRSMPRACVARPYLSNPAFPGGTLRNLAHLLVSRPSLPVHDSPSVSLPVPCRRWEASPAIPLRPLPVLCRRRHFTRLRGCPWCAMSASSLLGAALRGLP